MSNKQQKPGSSLDSRSGFTLIELLVVIAIIGILISLMIPAVQYAREAARRMSCRNKLKNQTMAILLYHDSYKSFPAGNLGIDGFDHSWALYALPYMEQGNVFKQIDLAKPWYDAGGNLQVALTEIATFRCPTSLLDEEGETDYAGIRGSVIGATDIFDAMKNGVLVFVSQPTDSAVRLGDITDGTSNTLCIAESPDRSVQTHGGWADGVGTIHCDGTINQEGSISSNHAGGAYGAFCDGHVSFLSETASEEVIGSLCTRNRM